MLITTQRILGPLRSAIQRLPIGWLLSVHASDVAGQRLAADSRCVDPMRRLMSLVFQSRYPLGEGFYIFDQGRITPTSKTSGTATPINWTTTSHRIHWDTLAWWSSSIVSARVNRQALNLLGLVCDTPNRVCYLLLALYSLTIPILTT